MDAAGSGEPSAEGQDGKRDISDDSDSGQVIIELDQSQIASPSDSEEEGQIPESPPPKQETSSNKLADLDAVSDIDDIPDDDDPQSLPAKNKETVADESTKTAADHDPKSTNDRLEQQDSEGCLSQGSEVALASTTPEGSASDIADSVKCSNIGDSVKHKEEHTVDCNLTTKNNSGAADSATKDSLILENTTPSEADRTEKVSPEDITTVATDSDIENKGVECTEEGGSNATVKEASPEAVLSTAPDGDKEPAETKEEEPPKVKGSGDLFAIAEDVSDVSSEGEAPLSPVGEEEEKPSVEQLSKEAAHQAEALAPLGAEPVSDPESGEDMGSDDSSPVHSPDYSSPVVVTSTSRISLGSGDYADARARATSRSPRKSDSAIISDSASSIQPADRSDRLSLEDGIIPVTLSTSDNKLDLSASMDMENISDDENIGEDNDSEDTSGEIEDEPEEVKAEETVSSSTQQAEEEGQKELSREKSMEGEHTRRPIMIASLGDKQQVQTHFSEEQVELDYEDVDGEGDADEGEIKPEDEDDGKEEGEDSDTDEGEIDDDDDCEEGEIKEPGIVKKPFVKPTCRFFMRGTCTWGMNCRFLHPGINDKGNYQMIELPGQRWNGPGGGGGAPWGQEPPEEPVDIPPPPEAPPVESAWERGLRHAKEQIKKASQRKEQESNFEEKRLNLSVDEEREMNKENDRRMVVHVPIVKDPYYDQAAFDEEEYYKQRGVNLWQSGRYENFEVRYNRESYSPYRGEKEYYPPPPERYPRHFSPPVDKFGRHPRMEARPDPPPYRPNRMEEMRAMSPSPPVAAASPPSRRPADEWHDPWRRSAKHRSKSPKANRRGRSRSRSRRGRRSLSDSSVSSGQKKKKTRPVPPVKPASSRSGSRSSDSHSSRSRSYSSGSSRSGSRSPEPAPPGVDRGERNFGPPPGRFMDGPRSAVSVRGRDRGGHWRGQDGGRQGYRNRGGGFQRGHHPHDRHQRPLGPPKLPERGFPPGYGYNRPPPGQRPLERRIPPDAMRPRKIRSVSSSGSSHSRSRSRSRSGSRSGSSSSFSRSRSGSAGSRTLGSRSRSVSSISSHTSSSSSSSSGSADSDNLYRDLGGPSPKKKIAKDKDKEKEAAKPPHHIPPPPAAPRGERKHPVNPPIRRPTGPPPPPPSDHPPRPPRSDMRPDGRADRPPPPDMRHDGRVDRPPPPDMRHEGRVDRPPPPDMRHDGRVDRPPPPDMRHEGRADRPPPPDMRHEGRVDRGNAERSEPPARGGRPDRPAKPDRPERPDRPPRPERAERLERMERERGENSRPERVDRGDRPERERGAAAAKPVREQSSRPPPSLQAKAKDPMKLMGLKSNIKLSLVSKQPGEKSAAGVVTAPPMKRRLPDGGDGPPAKRPALPASPVKMPSEKAVKPQAGRDRVRSPLERQPRSGSAAIPASLPIATAASIPLPPPQPKPPPPSPDHPPANPRTPSPQAARPPNPSPSPLPQPSPLPAAPLPPRQQRRWQRPRRARLLGERSC
ncbi:hypothetical protein ACOMHN_007024 [Nucella lapillus]